MRLSDKSANILGGKVTPTPASPAKITSATLKNNKGVVKFVLGLPIDPLFSSYAIYALDNQSATQPSFPGGSPILRDKTSKPEDDSATIGRRRHYWVVTMDKTPYPNSPVEANAFYVGSIIPSITLTLTGVAN